MTDKELVELAQKAKENAYTPAVDFRVGAALITKNGKIYTGCNINTETLLQNICAERVAIIKAVSEGEIGIEKIAVTSDSSDYTYPCGICRQSIAEFGSKDTKVIVSNTNGEYITYSLDEILPHSFTKEDL